MDSGARYLTQDDIGGAARTLVESATTTLDIASPWIEPFPIQRLVSGLLPRVRAGELKVRIVYRVAEQTDLRITDLAVLDALSADGVEVRYSRRLHAKLLVADRARALVGSSNLTRRGGYGYGTQPEWRNEEGVVLLEDDQAAQQASAHFEQIWAAASEISPELVGVVMDFPSVREFRFIAVKPVQVGQLVVASEGPERTVVGEIVELTAYNESFPQMTPEMFLSQGYGAGGTRRVTLPDLPSLFSHPNKNHGFLTAKTFFHPESAFQIGRVTVLRDASESSMRRAAVPIAPGSDVLAASAGLLRGLLGAGDLRLGRLAHHGEVTVWVRSEEILSKHLAVLGQTGSGKSNAVKHLMRELMRDREALRLFVIDTHGEYLAAAREVHENHVWLDVSVPDKINLLDWEMVKEHFRIPRMDASIKTELRDASRHARDSAQMGELLATSKNSEVREIAAAVSSDPGAYCVGVEAARIVVAGTVQEADLRRSGVYVLDLRETETFEVRSMKAAVLAAFIFADAKATPGAFETLLVVDEAHNYVPERTTGYMAEAARHGSLGAITTIAVEGRKFNLGLAVVTQRPSRVAKDVLAQLNSQLIFRLANSEDLRYVRESFEGASESFAKSIPDLDTGVCVAAGTMMSMPVQCDVPLFATRHRFTIDGQLSLSERQAAEVAIRRVLPEADSVEEDTDVLVFSDDRTEVSLRSADGSTVLDVDCNDPALAGSVHEAVVRSVRR